MATGDVAGRATLTSGIGGFSVGSDHSGIIVELAANITPSAGKVFNFVPGDIGRPIADIKSTIDVADLDRWVLERMRPS